MRKALRASAAIVIAAGLSVLGLAAPATAQASSTYVGHICAILSSGDCLVATNPVTVPAPYASTTNWVAIQDGTWASFDTYEFQQYGTNNCLTFNLTDEEAGKPDIEMHTCDGIVSELWVPLQQQQTGVGDYYYIENEYASEEIEPPYTECLEQTESGYAGILYCSPFLEEMWAFSSGAISTP